VLAYVLAIVLVAFIFDFINGFHDAANSIATVVGTRVLAPIAAVAWAAFFSFVALFVFGTKVANTIGSGMIDTSIVNPDVILSGLLGAITWNPIIMSLLLVSQASVGQLGANFSFLHVTDPTHIPLWVKAGAHLAIGLGTLMGGWRIIHTMGSRVTKLRPVGGFCAESGGAVSILLATGLGIPVSTTHAISGAIVGVGATTRLSAVRWGGGRPDGVGVGAHHPCRVVHGGGELFHHSFLRPRLSMIRVVLR